MNEGQAETIALEALGFIASSPRHLERFIAQTGATQTNLREQAADPAFLGGVLDFVLSSPDLLEEFCASLDLPPETPAKARRALPGANDYYG